MFRIAIFVAILLAARANTLDKNENRETALKRLLKQGEGSLGQFEESDGFRFNIEEEEDDDNVKEDKDDDDDDEEEEEEHKNESGSIGDDFGEDWNDYESTKNETKETNGSIDNDFANENTVEDSLTASLSQLNDMIKKANPDLRESMKRSFEDEDMIEGDIKLDQESAAELVEFYKRNPQYLSLDANVPGTPFTDAMPKRKVERSRKWTMPINYRIEGSTSQAVVRKAIRIWQQETCLRFRERETFSPPGITFTGNYSGCWAHVARRTSGNLVNLGYGCQAADRDTYVTIQRENIMEGRVHNFLIKPSTTYGTKYDYGSIMHYRDTAFAKKRGLKTIIAKQPNYEVTMGQNIALSFYDIKAANYHYCQGTCSGGLKWSKCQNDGYRNPNSCSRCKCPDGWTGKYCTIPSYSRPAVIRPCGNRYRFAISTHRSLKSPGYPCPGYTKKAECTWKIRAPIGKRVQLFFSGRFSLKCNSPCLDFVEVRHKSLSATGPRFCCNKRPLRTFTSSGREMLVLFRTYSGRNAEGFIARYRYI